MLIMEGNGGERPTFYHDNPWAANLRYTSCISQNIYSSRLGKNAPIAPLQQNLAKTRKQLLAIKEIGPWTTEIIMMRCFGDADAFPKSDLIIKKDLAQGLVDEAKWKTNRSCMTHYIRNTFTLTI